MQSNFDDSLDSLINLDPESVYGPDSEEAGTLDRLKEESYEQLGLDLALPARTGQDVPGSKGYTEMQERRSNALARTRRRVAARRYERLERARGYCISCGMILDSYPHNCPLND